MAVSIAASLATGGVGGAVMGAGLSSLAGNGAVNAINALGRGDGLESAIQKTLSEENLKGAAISMATSGFGKYSETSKWSNYVDEKMTTRMLMGGISGRLTTGDFSGFLRGMAAGVIPADMWTSTYANSALGNTLVTGVREYARGRIVNGQEGAEFYLKGAILNNVIGHAVNYAGSGFDTPEFKDGVWVYDTKENRYGLSIGNANGVSTDGKGEYNKDTLKHERQHSQFQDPLGPWYLPIHMINQGIYHGSGYEFKGMECMPWMPEDNGGYECKKK